MDRRIVLASGAIVAAAAIVLAVKVRSSDPPSPARGPTPEPTVVERERPHLESRQPGTPGGAEPVSETVTETSRVRDHRTGDRVPYDPSARGAKRTAQRLPPELVHALSKQLEAAMAECTAAIPAESRGPAPGVTGSVFVDVAGGSLQVTETAIELRDLTGDAATAAKRCIEARWVGQTAPASDGVAATHYEISVVFAVSSR
jgi:hypothetical protein